MSENWGNSTFKRSGTWTATAGATVVNLTGTPATDDARYIRLGNYVICTVVVTGFSITTGSIRTGFTVTGMPFAALTNGEPFIGSILVEENGGNSEPICGNMQDTSGATNNSAFAVHTATAFTGAVTYWILLLYRTGDA